MGTMMPECFADNREYVHNHVLRSAVNGTWGDDIVWPSRKHGILSFSVKVQEDWNLKNLSAIAFVYNDKGVHQVCQCEVD